MVSKISKVVEIDNCNKELAIEALYKSKFWEVMSPVDSIVAEFTAPNVLFTKIRDNIKVVKIPVEMEGELVLVNKGEDPEKGQLIQFNVRNNKDVQDLEGNIRIKAISPSKSKIGVFINNFSLGSNFLNIFGNTTELVLRTKITGLLRNLENYCKNRDLKELLK